MRKKRSSRPRGTPARSVPARSNSGRARPHLEALLERRIAPLEKWLEEHAPHCATEQAHLNEGTRERAYWHYGYVVALTDVRAVLRNGRHLRALIRGD